jgi:hypothetical protein
MEIEQAEEVMEASERKLCITWNNEEDRAFQQGFEMYGRQWIKMKNAYPEILRNRDVVAIKDRHRNTLGGRKH